MSGMSISAYGSTFVLVIVEGNVVQNVVGLGQKKSLEGRFLLLWGGVDEGVQVGWRESYGGPLPVCVGKDFALVALISIAQKITIRPRKLVGLAAFPELADGEIAAEMLGIHTSSGGKEVGKERLRPKELSGIGSGVDKLELG